MLETLLFLSFFSMKRGDILPHVRIEKLVYGGNGLSTNADGKRIVIIGWGIPGSIVSVRVLKSKKNYLETQVYEVEKPSPMEQKIPEKFEVYGGCKWIPIPYEMQLTIKQEQVHESLRFFIKPDVKCHTILPSPELYGYRNKIEFSWGKYISEKENIHDDFRFGFHKQGAFDRVINMKYCALADEEANAIFSEIDTFSRASGLPTYDPKNHIGFWRHLVIRRSKKQNQTMLVFSLNHDYDNIYDTHRKLISDYLKDLSKKYPHLHAAYILKNNGKADIVQGELDHCFGETCINEEILGNTFSIQPKSFFQVNTPQAEQLYKTVRIFATNNTTTDHLLDLYAGTGTIGIILAPFFKKVTSVEIVADAVRDGKKNCLKNKINNVNFYEWKVENFLLQYKKEGTPAPDTIVIDPPRDGLHPSALDVIRSFAPRVLVYVSCNPATLARDLWFLLQDNQFRLTDVMPIDMFPHTHHIETVIRLEHV